MGLILDSCILIAVERQGGSAPSLLRQIELVFGTTDIGISTISVVELTHGIFRYRTSADQSRRRAFAASVFNDIAVYPVTLEIAQLAGRIEGEQAAKGVAIPFEDLVIGSTALYLGFDILTQNVRHFQLIPGLNAVTL